MKREEQAGTGDRVKPMAVHYPGSIERAPTNHGLNQSRRPCKWSHVVMSIIWRERPSRLAAEAPLCEETPYRTSHDS